TRPPPGGCFVSRQARAVRTSATASVSIHPSERDTVATVVIGLGETAGGAGAGRWETPGFWRLNGINTFWAASQGLWNATYVLLAISAAVVQPSQKELVVSRATAVGGALAVLVPIAAGWLSDRTRSRWGRRTPWIAAGAAVNVVGLALLAWAPSVPALIIAYVVLQLGNNAAGAA